MLYSEFYDRTGVSVDAKEYAAIEEVYYHFSGDKDEFCKWWCKMNSDRVKAAKKARKEAEKEAKQKERLMVIMIRLEKKRDALRNDYTVMPDTDNFLSKSDQDFLERLGFRMFSEQETVFFGYIYKRYKRIDDTAWEIRKYLKLAYVQ